MSGIPTAVQKQMDDATLSMQQDPGQVAIADDAAATPSPVPVPAPSAEPTPPTAVVEPTPPAAPPAAPAAPTPPVGPTALRPQAAPAPSDELAKAEQRYKVLQGMHKAEVKKVSDQGAEIERLKADAATIAQQQAMTGPIDLKAYGITDEQIAESGQEFWETQVRISRATAAQQAPAPAQQSTSSEELAALTGRVEEQAREAFYQRLGVLIPDWEKTDLDPKWHEWLEALDPATGLRRQVLLEDALAHNDDVRMAAIFNLYRGQPTAATVPASQPTVHVVPDTTSPAAQSVVNGKTITFDQWQRELALLPSRGLSAEEFVEEDNRLQKMVDDGQVTGTPGEGADAPTAFI